MNKAMNLRILAGVVAGLAMAGCGPDEEQAKPGGTGAVRTPVAALPAGLFVDQAPPGSRGVAEIKADAGATGEIVVHGRIGGRVRPFVDGAAVFLLADTGMKTCADLHGDACKTPWDYCCEPRDSLAARTATVQIVDAEGQPLRIDLDGRHGMSPLAEVTVAGEVAHRDGGSLVINARKIHVKRLEG